jgi:hypothetical protein
MDVLCTKGKNSTVVLFSDLMIVNKQTVDNWGKPPVVLKVQVKVLALASPVDYR